MYLSYLLNAYSCGMTLSLPEFTSALSLSPYYYAISHIHYYVLNGNVLAKRFPSPTPCLFARPREVMERGFTFISYSCNLINYFNTLAIRSESNQKRTKTIY